MCMRSKVVGFLLYLETDLIARATGPVAVFYFWKCDGGTLSYGTGVSSDRQDGYLLNTVCPRSELGYIVKSIKGQVNNRHINKG